MLKKLFSLIIVVLMIVAFSVPVLATTHQSYTVAPETTDAVSYGQQENVVSPLHMTVTVRREFPRVTAVPNSIFHSQISGGILFQGTLQLRSYEVFICPRTNLVSHVLATFTGTIYPVA